jgi:hypothetical protein
MVPILEVADDAPGADASCNAAAALPAATQRLGSTLRGADHARSNPNRGNSL